MGTDKKRCTVCGGILGKYRHRACSDECARVLRRQSVMLCRKRKKLKRSCRRALTQLEEISLEASCARMTYGKYVAKLYGEPHIERKSGK